MRQSLRHLFTDHPASVGESYGQHFLAASYFGVRMIAGGFACLLHGILPCTFVRTGSLTVSHLYNRMVTNRRRVPPKSTDPIVYEI